jgi:hypothetical protein
LEELPPRQILEASLPYWSQFGGPDRLPEERIQALEAWIMLHAEQMRSLLDVPPLIQWSWKEPTPTSAGFDLPSGWWENPDELPLETQQALMEALVGRDSPVDLASTLQILGLDYSRRRLQLLGL